MSSVDDGAGAGRARPPLVSVITIFRNAPTGFFEQAIASVRAQASDAGSMTVKWSPSTLTSVASSLAAT